MNIRILGLTSPQQQIHEAEKYNVTSSCVLIVAASSKDSAVRRTRLYQPPEDKSAPRYLASELLCLNFFELS